ncbi:UNKNOWN [Stylonychia lemnae]|uniref:Uncharacterized protein n=1 Tax=Stylonychia lemnae TaxID=5949 RepID=A0A078ATA8_STYLE|nr:UNKNOWN [Stylonychia lemnae]|eukprot:CDW84108.1 UNKNOWN [Stylonychia lemnae]
MLLKLTTKIKEQRRQSRENKKRAQRQKREEEKRLEHIVGKFQMQLESIPHKKKNNQQQSSLERMSAKEFQQKSKLEIEEWVSLLMKTDLSMMSYEHFQYLINQDEILRRIAKAIHPNCLRIDGKGSQVQETLLQVEEILKESQKDLYLDFRDNRITYDQLKARLFERRGVGEYKVYDDIKKDLHPSIIDGLDQYGKVMDLLYKGKDKLEVSDLLKPYESWQINHRCLKTIQYKHIKDKLKTETAQTQSKDIKWIIGQEYEASVDYPMKMSQSLPKVKSNVFKQKKQQQNMSQETKLLIQQQKKQEREYQERKRNFVFLKKLQQNGQHICVNDYIKSYLDLKDDLEKAIEEDLKSEADQEDEQINSQNIQNNDKVQRSQEKHRISNFKQKREKLISSTNESLRADSMPSVTKLRVNLKNDKNLQNFNNSAIVSSNLYNSNSINQGVNLSSIQDSHRQKYESLNRSIMSNGEPIRSMDLKLERLKSNLSRNLLRHNQSFMNSQGLQNQNTLNLSESFKQFVSQYGIPLDNHNNESFTFSNPVLRTLNSPGARDASVNVMSAGNFKHPPNFLYSHTSHNLSQNDSNKTIPIREYSRQMI